ncbi:MAG: hypothetical protein K2M64_04150 [Clostridia bacterium]|nr:hypothetical protein [Clostridia bacterium]
MKKFFNIKRIIYLSIVCVTLLTLIFLLIFPIGVNLSSDRHPKVKVYCPYHKRIEEGFVGKNTWVSPFTTKCIWLYGGLESRHPDILLTQTIVFTIVGIIFVVFLALFAVELKRAGVFTRKHRPTKTEQMQAQIDELQKQVDELTTKDDK